MAQRPKVAVLMGSESDLPVVQGTVETLERFGVPFELRVMSAHRTPEAVEQFAGSLATALRRLCEQLGDGAQVLGPAPAPIAKIRGRHRHHLLIKCPDSRSVAALMQSAAGILKGPASVKVVVDVDPQSML